ncbi:hypothetical protein BC828DRAFT_403877 [Blastocladiella britannica]|nr:hypothetical protein BC828DRAFT_403877 [Blastocladiella britannica]
MATTVDAFFGNLPTDKAVSKAIGIMSVVPSMLVTLSVINCILQGYKARPIQKAVLAASAVSLFCDLISGYAHIMSLVNYSTNPGAPTWKYWPQITVTMQALKNIHAIASVHLVYLRFAAVMGLSREWQNRARYYTMGFTMLATLTTALHVYSYAANNWSSGATHEFNVYKSGYRPLNIVTTLYYAMLAVYTDISFMTMSISMRSLQSRVKVIAQFYNITYYTIYEIVTLFVVLAGMTLGIFYGEIGWGPYVEQLLLALIALNATYSVKTIAVIPGDSTGTSSKGGNTSNFKSQFYVPGSATGGLDSTSHPSQMTAVGGSDALPAAPQRAQYAPRGGHVGIDMAVEMKPTVPSAYGPPHHQQQQYPQQQQQQQQYQQQAMYTARAAPPPRGHSSGGSQVSSSQPRNQPPAAGFY